MLASELDSPLSAAATGGDDRQRADEERARAHAEDRL